MGRQTRQQTVRPTYNINYIDIKPDTIITSVEEVTEEVRHTITEDIKVDFTKNSLQCLLVIYSFDKDGKMRAVSISNKFMNFENNLNNLEQRISEGFVHLENPTQGTDVFDLVDTPITKMELIYKEVPKQGGVATRGRSKIIEIGNMKILEVRSSNINVCAITATNHFFGFTNTKNNPNYNVMVVRTRCKLDKDSEITFDDLNQKLSPYYRTEYTVYNTVGEIIFQTNNGYNTVCPLLWRSNHFNLILTNDLKDGHNLKHISKCENCGEVLLNLKTREEHKCFFCGWCGQWVKNLEVHRKKECNENVKRYYEAQIQGKLPLDKLKKYQLTPREEWLYNMYYNLPEWYHESTKKRIENMIIEEFNKNKIKFDFETGEIIDEKDGIRKHMVVKVGFVDEGKYECYTGKNSLSQFINYIHEQNSKGRKIKLIGQNSSGFDLGFIKDELEERELDVSYLCNEGKQYIDFRWKVEREIKFIKPKTKKINTRKENIENDSYDIYLFTSTSLEKACKDYKVTIDGMNKGTFPHLFIKSWDDLYYKGELPPIETYPPNKQFEELTKRNDDEEYRNSTFDCNEELSKYLKQDVLLTDKLDSKFSLTMFLKFKIVPHKYMTLAQASFSEGVDMIEKGTEIEIPKNKVKYNAIEKSIYGGRVWVLKRLFFSKKYEKYMNYFKFNHYINKTADNFNLFDDDNNIISIQSEEDKEICKQLFIDEDDYLGIHDVVSLYPTSMKKPLFTGYSRWARFEERKEIQKDIDEGNYDKIKYGIYKVDIIKPNDKLFYNILPSKNKFGNTTWDYNNLDNQWYHYKDMISALKHGTKLRIKSALIYPDEKPVFQPYIDKVYAEKAKQDFLKQIKSEDYNPSLRATSKLMMNAPYGKLGEKNHIKVFKKCYNEKDVIDFLREHEWLHYFRKENYEIMVGNKLVFENSVTKPIQQGSGVLANSREIMTDIFDKLDPERLKPYDEIDLNKSYESSPYATDTDCVVIHCSQEKLIKELIYEYKKQDAVFEEDMVEYRKELGQLENEMGENKIICGFFVAPKMYCAIFVCPDGSIKARIRGKGVSKNLIRVPMYEDMVVHDKSVKIEGMEILSKKRKPEAKTRTKGCSLDEFYFCNESITKEFNKNNLQNGKEYVRNKSGIVPAGMNLNDFDNY